MLRLLPSCALALSANLLTAQSASPPPAAPAPSEPAASAAAPPADLAAAKARAAAALQKCGALADTSFAVRWGPDKKKKDAGNPLAVALGRASSGATTGSWHQDRQRVVFDNDNDDELLIAGRRTLARDGTTEWALRSARYADGNTVPFVPDVPLLLQQLAAMDLAVVHRAAGALDDRPVEVVSATLTADQAAQLVWSGALPAALVTPGEAGSVFRFAAMGARAGGARPAATTPDATVDLAIHLDPGTNLVHKLHFRGWTKANAAGAPGVVMVAAGAGRIAIGGADEEEEDEDEDDAAEPAADAPLVWENGLPNRPRKKVAVNDVVVKLTDHGTTQAAPLTDVQRQLLGR